MAEIFSVLTDETSLGEKYTRGMRNLRFNDGAVTWVWDGSQYVIK